MEYTEWFGPNVEPVRVGLYQCKYCLRRHKWDGKEWPDGYRPFLGWRGITKESHLKVAPIRDRTHGGER